LNCDEPDARLEFLACALRCAMPRTQEVAKFTILALALVLALGPARRLQFPDLAAERDVLELKMRKLGLQFFVACTQPFTFARALGADLVADLVAAHPTANASGGLALLQHLRRNWGRLRRGLPCGLLAALAVGPGLDVGNFPTFLLLRSDRCDRLVIDLDRLRDLPVRLRRVGLDQLRDQFVLLLAGQMAAVNVRADDEG